MMKRLALALLLACLLLVAGVSALNGYDYYQTVEYAACDQEVYQQDIVIHRTTGTAYNETSGGLEIWHIFVGDHCREDYGDIRFTNSTGAELAYYLWPDHDAESARFTVRLEGATTAGTLAIWYGNPAATTTSDGAAVFPFFDDFPGDSLDGSKWTSTGGTAAVSGGILTYSTAGTQYYLTATSTFGVNYVWRARAKFDIVVGTDNFQSMGLSNTARYSSDYGNNNLREARTFAAAHQATTVNPSAGSYHIWEVQRNGTTNVIFKIDDSTVATHATQVPSGAYAPEFSVKNAGRVYCDYVLIRAYSATPPAATAFSGEQGPVTAAFSANVTTGCAPLIVAFTDTSDCDACTNWSWDVDGDDVEDYSTQNPVHTYNSAGVYTVRLNVTNATGSDWENKTEYITVSTSPTAAFSGNVTSGAVPLTVLFTDASTGYGITAWSWDVDGDGVEDYSTQNATHTYSSIGTYTVSLNVTNPCGSDWENKTDYITVSNATSFTRQDIPMSPAYTLTVNLRDYATNAVFLENATVSSSDGQTTTTSSGSATLTLDYGIWQVCAASVGYVGSCENVYMTSNKSVTLTLYQQTERAEQWQLYPPHPVRFQFVNHWGVPLTMLTVTATPTGAATAPWDWITKFLGLPTDISPLNTTPMTGLSGVDGSLTFYMSEVMEYQITVVNASQGISETFILYPKETEYVYMIRTGSAPVLQKMPEYDIIITENETHTMFALTYDDAAAETSSLYFIVKSEGSEVHNQSVSLTGGSGTDTYTVANVRGAEYTAGFVAQTAKFGTIQKWMPYTIKGSGPLFTLGLPAELRILIGIIFCVVLAGIFGSGTVKMGAFLVPFIGGGIFWWIGWWPFEMGVTICILSFFGAFVYMRKRDAEIVRGG